MKHKVGSHEWLSVARVEELEAENMGLHEEIERLRAALRPFAEAAQECMEQGGTGLNIKRFVTNRMVYDAARALEPLRGEPEPLEIFGGEL